MSNTELYKKIIEVLSDNEREKKEYKEKYPNLSNELSSLPDNSDIKSVLAELCETVASLSDALDYYSQWI